MITLSTGNLLESEATALVNTVNTVGVMGKGIALQFKETFSLNHKEYKNFCKDGHLKPGTLLSVWDSSLQTGKKLIINFPTKTHWRQKSNYGYIELGLESLKELIINKEIDSIAIPPLGCGNGGLDWTIVKEMIYEKLADLEVDIYLYEPNREIKSILQKQEQKKEVKLTPARASLLYVLFVFESLGEYATIFAANKLAYFLQRKGQKLNLQFIPYKYGPYAIGVEKVLYYLNGTYLKGLEQGEFKAFEPLQLNYEKWDEVNFYVNNKMKSEETAIVKSMAKFISSFSSELSLEILATVDFILYENPKATINDIMRSIQNWNDRKTQLFKRDIVEKVLNYLNHYKTTFETQSF
ncbi:type II toxin-antitoxin system antitoxin DNA ADP-ribosyl glycohydrolase DarG [Sphingobacterium humi]|uniref:Phosphatase n=1 Tax=Sphingobacterium humi TaxID=1796905 RepID=A0A6N8L653_9SPHI|nr:macro domain-containing protein [Sphingobacterium humi]MVZ63232.1 phosphatase [Sphingobacterium humi]